MPCCSLCGYLQSFPRTTENRLFPSYIVITTHRRTWPGLDTSSALKRPLATTQEPDRCQVFPLFFRFSVMGMWRCRFHTPDNLAEAGWKAGLQWPPTGPEVVVWVKRSRGKLANALDSFPEQKGISAPWHTTTTSVGRIAETWLIILNCAPPETFPTLVNL